MNLVLISLNVELNITMIRQFDQIKNRFFFQYDNREWTLEDGNISILYFCLRPMADRDFLREIIGG